MRRLRAEDEVGAIEHRVRQLTGDVTLGIRAELAEGLGAGGVHGLAGERGDAGALRTDVGPTRVGGCT